MIHQIGCHVPLIDAVHKKSKLPACPVFQCFLTLQTSHVIGLNEAKDLHEGVVTKDMS